MITFIIPIKSKQVSTDWPYFCKLYERTLKSIFNQTNENFNVLAVCHEIPEIEFKHHKLHYLQVDFEPPSTNINNKRKNLLQKRIDKAKKLKEGAQFCIKHYSSEYVMTVDSDDFISNKIAAFISNYLNTPNKSVPGWYVKFGYIYFENRNLLVKTRKFNELCGSSLIVKPDLIIYFVDFNSNVVFHHQKTNLNNHITLQKLPFRGGIYDLINGENTRMDISEVKRVNRHRDWASKAGLYRLYKKIQNYRPAFITEKLRKEYNFYN